VALRYAVGIDLGTSNTAIAFADLEAKDPGASVEIFPVPQLVAAGEATARPLLPSHLYLPGEHELPQGALSLPWDRTDPTPAVGTFARDQGARVPGRHVASAKSWLCHPSVDRTARILPWGAPPEVARLSPVEASARILAHLRSAWDTAHPQAPLAEQDLVVTVPASFDEGARALTLRAAAEAGLARLVLLEEPQAAFYDWTRVHRASLSEELEGVRLIFVCDIGGGTTDFTLVVAGTGEQEERALPATGGGRRPQHPVGPVLRRVAVGDHLLLGGDNMDIALARSVEARLSAKLGAGQWGALVQACRVAKERLLSSDAPEELSVAIPGTGSRLVGGALSASLRREEARALLLDGFLPEVARDAVPTRAARATGLAELGLPYAADPAITRHAAAFLRRHAPTVAEALGQPHVQIDAVLFNGGALAADALASRLTSVLQSWQKTPLRRLRNDAPDLAVARGAAMYGLVRRGLGLRIGGGSPRTYYVGVSSEGSTGALCVVPRGAAEGVPQEVPRQTFGLVLGKPVRFRLFAASGYRAEQPGDLVAIDDELAELPPLQTVVQGEGTAQVRLRSTLTEIGTLELFCVAEEAAGADAPRWKLEFQLRQSSAADNEGSGPVAALPRTIEQAREVLQQVYGKKPRDVQGREVKDLWRNLERALGDRASWTLATSRDLWSVLWAGAQKRRRTADHERLFLQLCGFMLRPGFGAPLDSWRCEQVFTLLPQGVTHHKEAAVWAAFWILWRRIAAGLGDAEHAALFAAIDPHLRPQPKGRVANPGKKPPGLAVDEMVRLLGALERLAPARKVEAGGWLADRLRAGDAPGVAWALGRLGARVPVAGAAHHVVPQEVAAAWVEFLLEVDAPEASFALAQLARLSGDRARDLPEDLRLRVASTLERRRSPPEWARAVREVVTLGASDEQRVFGESLPLGLHLG
jgi:molecular chaperone DnaK (HSP70)